MDVFDKIIKEHGWKFPKGYPDINNPLERNQLLELAKSLANDKINSLSENSETYDATIKNALKVEDIPLSKNKYQFNGQGGSTFSIKVQPDDKEIFDKLYGVKPPKVGQEVGSPGSLGVGNGEISLYWLYNYSKSGIKVDEGRQGDDPDLYFNGVGVEVKAYKTHTGTIGLGRFGQDRENLQLLSVVFGLNALSKAIKSGEAERSINPTNFKGVEIPSALQQVIDLSKIEDLDKLASNYDIFKSIKNNITTVKKELGNFSEAEEGAISLANKLLLSKLERKPGDGGYLANVKRDGDILFYGIKLDQIKNNKDLLANFGVSQSAILLKFSNIFK